MKHALAKTVLLGKTIVLVGIMCMAGVQTTYEAAAVDTAVNVTLRDTLPGTVAVSTPADGATTTSSSVIISGSVHNISQIMVYVDGVYTSTMPIDINATTYSVAVILSPGTHTIRLVGVDPYAGTQVEKVIAVSYTPAAGSQLPPTVSSPDGTAAALQGVLINARDTASEQISRASTDGPMKSLTDSVFTGLVSLGLINPRDAQQSSRMPLRFVSILAGLFLLPAPRLFVAGARRIRRIPLSTAYSSRTLWMLRVLGITLILLPFVALA